MFEPGHVHVSNPVAALGLPAYSVDIYYEVRPDSKGGAMVHFRLVGEIAGKAFEENFEMPHDTAFNFASTVGKVTAKHGMPPNHSPVLRHHKEFEATFADLRSKLQAIISGPVGARDPEADS